MYPQDHSLVGRVALLDRSGSQACVERAHGRRACLGRLLIEDDPDGSTAVRGNQEIV
jgi:hypothetical protein